MDKPLSAKAFYSEVESLYRSRVSAFIPFVNTMINSLGLEVGGVQLNDLYFSGKEFFLNPKEINPEREVFEDLNPSEDFLRFLRGLHPESYTESKSEAVNQLVEDLADLGVGDLHDYAYREDHTFYNQIFIRPKGTFLKISDIAIVGRLYQVLGASPAYRKGVEGWEGGVLDYANLVIAGPKGGFSEDKVSLYTWHYDYSFYRFVSEVVSIILSLPLLEAVLESGAVKSSIEVNMVPSLGKVKVEKNIYLKANTILALPSLEYIISPFSGKPYSSFEVTDEDVKIVIGKIIALKYPVSNQIVNPKVKELFLEEMNYLISEARGLLAKYWEKEVEELNLEGIEVTPGTHHVVADSPESLKPVLDLAFDRVKKSYEYLYSGGDYEPEDRAEPFTPVFSFAIANGGRSKEKLSKTLFVAGDSPFSRILSSIPEVLVSESTSIQRESRFGKKVVKKTSEVHLYPIGPRSKEVLEVSGGSAYDLVFWGDWVVGKDDVVEAMSPSLDPVYSLHAYLFPLVPALFYYGYASHLVLDPSPVKRGGTVLVEPRIPLLENEGGEVDEKFFDSFSERVLKTLDRLFKEVWEGTLEKDHEEYLKRAKVLLDSLSPSEDRIFCTVISDFTTGDASDLDVSLKLAVKFRPDEEFVSSLKDFLLSAVSLLHEIGDGVDVDLVFL